MLRYSVFCSGEPLDVSLHLRDVHIEMNEELVQFLISDAWDGREFCTKWITRWENILFCMQENPCLSGKDLLEANIYIRNRIITICATFGCEDLCKKYL